MNELRKKLKITNKAIEAVNKFLTDENNVLINDLFEIIIRKIYNNEKIDESIKFEKRFLRDERIKKKTKNY